MLCVFSQSRHLLGVDVREWKEEGKDRVLLSRRDEEEGGGKNEKEWRREGGIVTHSLLEILCVFQG